MIANCCKNEQSIQLVKAEDLPLTEICDGELSIRTLKQCACARVCNVRKCKVSTIPCSVIDYTCIDWASMGPVSVSCTSCITYKCCQAYSENLWSWRGVSIVVKHDLVCM